ncbi:MAG: DNA repair protein RecO [Clostridiales bacterium]|nr:DNA repair protein RecO [Clostridiales bacterium]
MNAIVLKSTDFGEADKLLQLYTAEEGRIGAFIRGVRKDKAKLKFAGQPFCLGEYIISRRGANGVVTNCTLTDSFFDLTMDMSRYYAACTVSETFLYCTEEGFSDPRLFVLLLKAFKELCYSGADTETVLCKFFMDFLRLSGYKLSFDRCAVCGVEPYGKIIADFRHGGVMCASCASGGHALSVQIYNNLRFINNTDFEQLSTLRLTGESLKETLRLLYAAQKDNLGVNLKTITNLL